MGAGTPVSAEGFRVIQVLPHSPLAASGVHMYLDFIVCANSLRLRNNGAFAKVVAKSAGQTLTLRVFNVLTREERETSVVPREEWGGEGLLGGTVRYEQWSSRLPFGLKVVEVTEKSPAAECGLVPSDFLLGTDSTTFQDIDHFVSVLPRTPTSLPIYVFNQDSLHVRKVLLRVGEGEALGFEAEVGDYSALLEDLADRVADTRPVLPPQQEATVTVLRSPVGSPKKRQ